MTTFQVDSERFVELADEADRDRLLGDKRNLGACFLRQRDDGLWERIDPFAVRYCSETDEFVLPDGTGVARGDGLGAFT